MESHTSKCFIIDLEYNFKKLNNERIFFQNVVKLNVTPKEKIKKILQTILIYKKKWATKALYYYLYQGIGIAKIDKELTKLTEAKGWIAWATLILYHIETNGINRGVLKRKGFSEKEALELIEEFVSDNEIQVDS